MAIAILKEDCHGLITMESRVVHWVVRSFYISPFIVGHTLLPDFPIYSPQNFD